MAAAILRTRSHLFSSAPPPSPIATAKGLRSAAIDDRILSEFLEKSLKVPDLTLPEPYLASRIPRRIPAEINLPSLLDRDEDSVHRLLESSTGLGAFQIIEHGISAEEIGEVINGSDRLLQVPMQKKSELQRHFGRRNEIREDLFWFRSEKEMEEKLAEEIGAETYRTFSENMGKLFVKLEAIAENVGRILMEHTRKRCQKRIEERESVLCIHKYNSNDVRDGSPLLDGQSEIVEDLPHALILHLSNSDLEFRVQSRNPSFSFSATAGAIIVTVGGHLQEWSQGEFKSVIGEPIFEPSIDANPSFSIEFASSPSSINHKLVHVAKTLSLMDQMLITLAITILYICFTYVYTKFTKI
ncbi:uncharacterized protein LOC131223817 [Magnolia sinica]|uniref:uncharacterized protein LOC131223817 n=1 Tax=Magnolia sinica TaxID=86752 RepID=UPI00265A741F|nr:uncharacterized protein LOC131223817 [Magnolia sinica]